MTGAYDNRSGGPSVARIVQQTLSIKPAEFVAWEACEMRLDVDGIG